MRSRRAFTLAAFALFFSIAVLQLIWVLAASQSGWTVILRFNDLGEGFFELVLALVSVAAAILGIALELQDIRKTARLQPSLDFPPERRLSPEIGSHELREQFIEGQELPRP